MSVDTYNSILMVIVCVGVIVAVALLVCLGLTVARWRTPARGSWMLGAAAAVVTLAGLVGVQQWLLWRVLLPSMAREAEARQEARRSERRIRSSKLEVGDSIPRLEVTTLAGETAVLAEPGKVTLINFFATWCGPCHEEIPHLERIANGRRSDPRFRMLVVGREETADVLRDYHVKRKLTLTMAADPDRSIFARFATDTIPRTVLVSAEGRIVHHGVGFVQADVAKLEAAIDRELAAIR